MEVGNEATDAELPNAPRCKGILIITSKPLWKRFGGGAGQHQALQFLLMATEV